MTKETLILKLIARKNILRARGRDNGNIIRKIDRQLCALQAA